MSIVSGSVQLNVAKLSRGFNSVNITYKASSATQITGVLDVKIAPSSCLKIQNAPLTDNPTLKNTVQTYTIQNVIVNNGNMGSPKMGSIMLKLNIQGEVSSSAVINIPFD